MSQELNAFFAKVSTDKSLQEQLFITKEVADVARIARKMGFQITGYDVLRAQATQI